MNVSSNPSVAFPVLNTEVISLQTWAGYFGGCPLSLRLPILEIPAHSGPDLWAYLAIHSVQK